MIYFVYLIFEEHLIFVLYFSIYNGQTFFCFFVVTYIPENVLFVSILNFNTLFHFYRVCVKEPI